MPWQVGERKDSTGYNLALKLLPVSDTHHTSLVHTSLVTPPEFKEVGRTVPPEGGEENVGTE